MLSYDILAVVELCNEHVTFSCKPFTKIWASSAQIVVCSNIESGLPVKYQKEKHILINSELREEVRIRAKDLRENDTQSSVNAWMSTVKIQRGIEKLKRKTISHTSSSGEDAHN